MYKNTNSIEWTSFNLKVLGYDDITKSQTDPVIEG